eukprot:TRINITY_DN2162_c0_g1_i1.p1 TRINITY_DN2162_c0_g1~~TRINITY_DN2162_c0_g1_i1.p1  ORF type:complete len:229 (-),score=-14.51 TRINITY_DN2162_c0_g1_i1:235-921(-)
MRALQNSQILQSRVHTEKDVRLYLHEGIAQLLPVDDKAVWDTYYDLIQNHGGRSEERIRMIDRKSLWFLMLQFKCWDLHESLTKNQEALPFFLGLNHCVNELSVTEYSCLIQLSSTIWQNKNNPEIQFPNSIHIIISRSAFFVRSWSQSFIKYTPLTFVICTDTFLLGIYLIKRVIGHPLLVRQENLIRQRESLLLYVNTPNVAPNLQRLVATNNSASVCLLLICRQD